MKKVLGFGIAAALSAGSFATVLTFDDVTALGQNLGNYGGLDWSNMYALDASSRVDGYNNGLVSGTNVAYNAFGNVATVTESPFTFNGAYFTGAWNDGLNITISAYQGATLAYEETIVVDTDAPTYFQFDFENITSLSFDTFGGVDNPAYSGAGTHFAMDNFTFNEAVSVPEPATAALLGLGLAGLAASRRRKQS